MAELVSPRTVAQELVQRGSPGVGEGRGRFDHAGGGVVGEQASVEPLLVVSRGRQRDENRRQAGARQLRQRAVDDLIDADRLMIKGPVVAEVLQGFRRRDQATWVASRLRLVHYWEPDWDDWISAATLGRSLAAKGHGIPLTDLILASVAMRLNLSVYSADPHFELFENLKRHTPD